MSLTVGSPVKDIDYLRKRHRESLASGNEMSPLSTVLSSWSPHTPVNKVRNLHKQTLLLSLTLVPRADCALLETRRIPSGHKGSCEFLVTAWTWNQYVSWGTKMHQQVDALPPPHQTTLLILIHLCSIWKVPSVRQKTSILCPTFAHYVSSGQRKSQHQEKHKVA